MKVPVRFKIVPAEHLTQQGQIFDLQRKFPVCNANF